VVALKNGETTELDQLAKRLEGSATTRSQPWLEKPLQFERLTKRFLEEASYFW